MLLFLKHFYADAFLGKMKKSLRMIRLAMPFRLYAQSYPQILWASQKVLTGQRVSDVFREFTGKKSAKYAYCASRA
jgi:hypothetical protein